MNIPKITSCSIVFLLSIFITLVGCTPATDDNKKSLVSTPDPLGPIVINDNNGADYNPVIVPTNFTTTITNPYFKAEMGRVWVYEGQNDEGETERIQVEVIPEDKMVMGVAVTTLRDRVWEDGELVEDTHDWFAQDLEGNVWYFGEAVDNYEDGELVDHEGSWEAGVDGAKPGIQMKANPQVGDAYRQEFLKGEAEDMGEVLSLSETMTTPAGTFENCIKIKDWTPLEPDVVEHKIYCQEVGNVVSEVKAAGEEGSVLLQSIGTSVLPLDEGKLLIERNTTDNDTGFQAFADGTPWNTLTLKNSNEASFFSASAEGGLKGFGLTEFFFETSEPENDEAAPIESVLKRIPEGTYTYSAVDVDSEQRSITATMTHDIPAGPVLQSPSNETEGIGLTGISLTWDAVTQDIDGDSIKLAGYQVIVEKDEDDSNPETFAQSSLSAYLSTDTTSFTIPMTFWRITNATSGKCWQSKKVGINPFQKQPSKRAPDAKLKKMKPAKKRLK